jgi:hypothetical protein
MVRPELPKGARECLSSAFGTINILDHLNRQDRKHCASLINHFEDGESGLRPVVQPCYLSYVR